MIRLATPSPEHTRGLPNPYQIENQKEKLLGHPPFLLEVDEKAFFSSSLTISNSYGS